jgi:hypothetical protein
MTFKISRQQIIRQQKNLGQYQPALHRPVEYPTSDCLPLYLVQSYWLQKLQEELLELEASKFRDISELVDVFIFTQHVHFTLTDETFVWDPSFQEYPQSLLDLTLKLCDICKDRKHWKTYEATEYNLARWFTGVFSICNFSYAQFESAYEAKLAYNLARKDWLNRV